MTETRCKHELVIEQCDHCKPRAAPALFMEPLPPKWSAPLSMNPGPWFEAQYGGTCAECGERFDAGDSIRGIGGGEYECRDCGES